MQIKGNKVTVVGLARSGTGAANLLSKLGAEVTVTDIKQRDELESKIKMLAPDVRLALGGHQEELFSSSDMIVVSPGVPLDIKAIVSARAKGIPVISELELAYYAVQHYFPADHSLPAGQRVPFLAITGTNGKSTTTSLLDYMLKKSGLKTLLGGNIGNALTEEILRQFEIQNSKFKIGDLDFIVAEVSSFQLEAIKTFRPHIAAILNLTPDHLDRYSSIQDYVHAKASIFSNQQGGDFLVLNADDDETMKMYSSIAGVPGHLLPGVCFFSCSREVTGIYQKNGIVFCNMPEFTQLGPHYPFIGVREVRLKGVHNLENAMAASAMALLADCQVETVTESLREFQGLEHRLEFVREINGVSYYNDSKGTNVGAVVKSLESFHEPLILIAGGRDKGGDFLRLRKLVARKVKCLVLIGEAAAKIKDALGDLTDIKFAMDLNEAVEISRNMSEAGDVVLLSPGCASFDMFRDFEDRGRQFKKTVNEMKDNE